MHLPIQYKLSSNQSWLRTTTISSSLIINQTASWTTIMRQYGSCVLSKFFFILKIASFFGIFPCSIKEKGAWKAKSALFCRTSWFLLALLVNSGCVISIWILISNAKDEFTLLDYFAAFFKDSPTMLDKLTFGGPIITSYSIGSILAFQLGGKGKTFELLATRTFAYMPKLKNEAKLWPLIQKVVL